MNLNLSLKYCANINSKSIRLKKYETKNYVFFRKNIGENLQDLGLSKEFLDLTPHIKFIRKNELTGVYQNFKIFVLWKILLKDEKITHKEENLYMTKDYI